MLGFTKQEQGIVLFLIFSLLVGCLVSLYNRFIEPDSIPQVNSHVIEEFVTRTQQMESAIEDTAIHNTSETLIPGSDESDNGYVEIALSRPTNDSPSERFAENISRVQDKFLININKANQEELQSIPQIGPALAKRIVDYRSRIGEFKSIEDLEKVKGIGPAKLKKIEPFISIK